MVSTNAIVSKRTLCFILSRQESWHSCANCHYWLFPPLARGILSVTGIDFQKSRSSTDLQFLVLAVTIVLRSRVEEKLGIWRNQLGRVDDMGDSRPNILFIMSDDHASHVISAYGSRINQTPNMDRIAAEGIAV